MTDIDGDKKRSEFICLVMDTAQTGDNAALSEWWRRHYPGISCMFVFGKEIIEEQQEAQDEIEL